MRSYFLTSLMLWLQFSEMTHMCWEWPSITGTSIVFPMLQSHSGKTVVGGHCMIATPTVHNELVILFPLKLLLQRWGPGLIIRWLTVRENLKSLAVYIHRHSHQLFTFVDLTEKFRNSSIGTRQFSHNHDTTSLQPLKFSPLYCKNTCPRIAALICADWLQYVDNLSLFIN